MRMAVLANTYGALSETFVRREVEALQAIGHDVTVFSGGEHGSVAGAAPTAPVVRWLDEAFREHYPEVLYASLGLTAHRRAVDVARMLNIPFALRCFSGHDMFVTPSPKFYANVATLPLEETSVFIRSTFGRNLMVVDPMLDLLREFEQGGLEGYMDVTARGTVR